MAWTVLDLGLQDGRAPLRDYSWTDAPLVATWKRKGPYHVQGVQLSPRWRRTWSWPIFTDEAARETLHAFLLALDWIRTPFLLRDPRDGMRRVTLEPAVGDGARVAFSLPTSESSEDFRFYPGDDGSASGFVAGAPRAIASVQTDARTLTFAAAPAAAAAVEGLYRPLRLVRLVAPPEWTSVMQTLSRPTLSIEEILRD